MHRFTARLCVPVFALAALAAACGGAAPPPVTAATSGADVKGSIEAKLHASLGGPQRTVKEK